MGYIFIGGAQRTGTTLLQHILCQPEESNPMIQEASYLRMLLRAYRLASQEKHLQDYFDSPEAFRKYHSRFVIDFLEHTRARYGKPQHLVLKDPQMTVFFPELFILLGDIRMICMVRDPRDAIGSMVKVGKTGESIVGRNMFPKELPNLCRHFLSFYGPVSNFTNPEFKKRVLYLRYEDLLQKPKETFSLLQQFTGLPLSNIDTETDFDSGQVNYEEDKGNSPWWSEHYGKKMSTAPIGRGKEEFSTEECTQIASLCESFMKPFAYSEANDA